jgi:hypothetical protein
MPEINFTEEDFSSDPLFTGQNKSRGGSWPTAFLYNHGLVKTEAQAKGMLIVASLVILALMFWVWSVGFGSDRGGIDYAPPAEDETI